MGDTAVQTKTARKILIIEDEGEMCLVLNILLSEEPLELDHVKTIADAEAYLEKGQPSVVILDNKLPDGFGVDYISLLKKNYPDLRIIMITGFDASARDVALENGADFFLQKPFTRDQFLKSLNSLLN